MKRLDSNITYLGKYLFLLLLLHIKLSPKLFQMSNNEFVSALCRRNTFEDPMVPKRAPITSWEDSSLLSCGCDGAARPTTTTTTTKTWLVQSFVQRQSTKL